MKFAWKVFLSTIMVIAVVFAIGGYVLITSSFDSALQRETERALEENQLMKLAYESAAIPYEGTKLTDEAVTIIASQLENGGRRGIVLSDENYKTVFSSFGGEDAEQELLKSTDEGRSYTIGEYSGEYWIAVSCKSIAGGRTMYLETSRDISDIFMQRTEQFRTYIKISIVLLLAAAGVMWLVSMFLTRPLRKLSATTRRIAQGNYSERMKVMSNDEIGDFTRDFNLMTDAVEDKIYDLENAARQKEDFVASFAHELKTPLTSITVSYTHLDVYKRQAGNVAAVRGRPELAFGQRARAHGRIERLCDRREVCASGHRGRRLRGGQNESIACRIGLVCKHEPHGILCRPQ